MHLQSLSCCWWEGQGLLCTLPDDTFSQKRSFCLRKRPKNKKNSATRLCQLWQPNNTSKKRDALTLLSGCQQIAGLMSFWVGVLNFLLMFLWECLGNYLWTHAEPSKKAPAALDRSRFSRSHHAKPAFLGVPWLQVFGRATIE